MNPTSYPVSFSRLKAYKTCPRQFYEVTVLKKYPRQETEATLYGTAFHEAAEKFIRDGVELPAYFSFAKQHLEILKGIEGDKYCEHEMGITKKFEPCGFSDEGVWVRGIADLLVVNEVSGVARVLDYKTGKSAKYADLGQLELMSLLLFKHFPKIRRVKAGLLFVVAGQFVKDTYEVDKESIYWRKWVADIARLERAYETNVWNPVKTGLCKAHCVVVDCVHNGKRG